MGYSYKTDILHKEFDEFVMNSGQAHLLQSSNWSDVKQGWLSDRLGVYEAGKLVAVASVLLRPLPLGYKLMYVPRGPIVDYSNHELVTYVLNALKDYGKKNRAVYIKFDPTVLVTENGAHADVVKLLTGAGVWTKLGESTQLGDDIQPRVQAKLFKDSFALENLPKRTQQEIRTARNKGLDVVFGGRELLADFNVVMRKTESRKGISLRNEGYYDKILDTYGDDAFITMTYIDLTKRKQVLDDKIAETQAKIDNANDKKRANLEKELDLYVRELNYIVYKLHLGRTRIPLAGTLTVNYGETSENLYAGMDADYAQYQAPVLTWFETAMKAFEKGANWHNLGGVEYGLDGGLYKFKSKFNPTIETYIGEFDLPVSKLKYRIFSLAYELRKKRAKKKK